MRKYSLILLAGILVFSIYSMSTIAVPSNILKINEAEADLEITGTIEFMDEMLDEDIKKDTNTTLSSNQQSLMKNKENTTKHILKFFVIQHAQSGSLSEINETAYSLELKDVSDKTILFSDRPSRIVKSVNTSNFIGNWSTGADSFAVDAPNAVLIIDESEKQDIAIIELFSPVYDSDKKTLKYEVTPYNATSIELPSEFGQTTMILDSPKPFLF